jgi:hypothetical protein
METIEKKLNTAIQTHGYRISPRGTLVDRLTRYVEMSTGLERDEASAVASLYLMRQQTSQNPEVRITMTNTYEQQPYAHRYNLRPRPETGSHPMTRRSQVAKH